MTGGPSPLRTAVMTLGLALGIFGFAFLLRSTVFHTGKTGEPFSLMAYASIVPPSSSATAPVTLETVESESPRSHLPTRTVSTSPAQLFAQIDDDLPPAPAQVTEPDDFGPVDALPPQRTAPPAPAAELMDVEPTPEPFAPPTPAPEKPAAPTTAPVCCERQEEQLARIASGIELLARQATQTVIERTATESVPTNVETFVTPSERETTAILRIERTAEDRDRFSFSAHSVPVRDVLQVLCELAELRLELAPGITERVTLTLRDVTLGEAINAVMQQSKLGIERDDHLLRVMSVTMAEERATRRQPLVTKIYRPQVVRMADLLPLIRPLMTSRTGRLAVMPDPGVKLCPDNTCRSPSLPAEILVIVDRPEVHAEVTKLLGELDALRTSR